jgi:hypothetical protein
LRNLKEHRQNPVFFAERSPLWKKSALRAGA